MGRLISSYAQGIDACEVPLSLLSVVGFMLIVVVCGWRRNIYPQVLHLYKNGQRENHPRINGRFSRRHQLEGLSNMAAMVGQLPITPLKRAKDV